MTKEELDEALYQVKGFIPVIVVGPGHLIFTYDGWNDPKPQHYRGVPVILNQGHGDRCEVVDMLSI